MHEGGYKRLQHHATSTPNVTSKITSFNASLLLYFFLALRAAAVSRLERSLPL